VVIAVVMSDPASRAASKADSPALVSLWVLSLILLLPSWAVLVRRLHDTDRPGWFVLIVLIPVLGAVVLLVTLASRGTEGPNHYGPDPSGSSKPASLWVSWPPRTCPFCAAMIESDARVCPSCGRDLTPPFSQV
jgi:hypothetical protein